MQDLYAAPKIEDYKDLWQNLNADNDIYTKTDYGENIQIRRLINNQVINIDEEEEENFLKLLEEEESENSIFQNKGDNFEDEDDFKIFTHSNSIELVKKALNTHHKHDLIVKFKLYSTLWIIFIIFITSKLLMTKYFSFGILLLRSVL